MIEAYAERLDLYADMEANVEGATDIFADGRHLVRINRRLSTASHLINRLRNTLAHEFYHLFFHAPLYQEKWKQMDLFCNAGERIACTREAILLKGKKVDWREWQAAYGAGALLMPATALQRLARDLASTYRPPPYMVGSQEGASVISRVASRFAVSREAAKVRLLQKGLLASSSDHQQLFLFANQEA
jgi:Zn-dependent peptidase ImmA (M78 family)